jgi:hypothetical protein
VPANIAPVSARNLGAAVCNLTCEGDAIIRARDLPIARD